MQVNRDFADLFAALNAADARYLLVGGYAVAFHAEPRFTKDLDVWIEATADNAERVHRALAAFGAPLAGITASDLATPGNEALAVIGRDALIRNKRASGRPQDLLDVERLTRSD